MRSLSYGYRQVFSSNRMGLYDRLRDEDRTRLEGTAQDNVFGAHAELEPHPGADNPVLTADDVDDVIASFVADPFLVYQAGLYHMFFEIKDIAGDVYIAHAFSEDGLSYTYNQIVISPERAQHTYPYVFRYEGEWVMVPSPGANVNGQFRVYVATDFPTEWELIAIPIAEGVRQDPTPIHHEGTWYLIYQNMDSWDVDLVYADSLTDSSWTIHPDSPIFRNDVAELEACSIGAAEMVPSGRPLYGENEITIFYRSHCNREVYEYRITNLSTESFKQARCTDHPMFSGQKNDNWNSDFMHTISPVYPWGEDEDIVAVDGLSASNKYSIGIYRPYRGR